MTTCRSRLAELLPQYAAGTLSEQERRAVAGHLAACPACREELAFWQDVGAAVVAENAPLPAPPPALLEGALARVSRRRHNPFARAWALLRAQMPLVRQELWLASALVMAIGYLLAVMRGGSQSGSIITAVAPLVAAAGLATIYGPDNDPALELALATPTSPQQVLLARLVVVFGYDLLLGLAATAGLAAVVPVALLGEILLGWLAPMAFLSALALVLSMCVGTGNGVTIALMLWLARWLILGVRLANGTPSGAAIAGLLQAYSRFWQSPALLLTLAAALVVVALALAGRQERLMALRV